MVFVVCVCSFLHGHLFAIHRNFDTKKTVRESFLHRVGPTFISSEDRPKEDIQGAPRGVFVLPGDCAWRALSAFSCSVPVLTFGPGP